MAPYTISHRSSCQDSKKTIRQTRAHTHEQRKAHISMTNSNTFLLVLMQQNTQAPNFKGIRSETLVYFSENLQPFHILVSQYYVLDILAKDINDGNFRKWNPHRSSNALPVQ